MNKKVAAIVVTFNRITLLKECIEALRKQSYADFSIIVVDNGSTDGTNLWLSEQGDLIVVKQENLGGAGGFYAGIRYACEHGFEYSWIMDDDVVANINSLENLMKHCDDVNGFLCSHVLDLNSYPCNVPKISMTKSKVTGELLWGEKIDKGLLRVDVTSFVSLLFRNSLVYEIGLPYKEYFIWGDDTEYTTRISMRYSSYMVLDSVVVHKRKIQGVLSIFTEKDKNRIKNYFYAYRNRIHGQHSFGKSFLWCCYSIMQALKLLFTGNFYKAYIVCKAILCSLFFSPQIKFPGTR